MSRTAGARPDGLTTTREIVPPAHGASGARPDGLTATREIVPPSSCAFLGASSVYRLLLLSPVPAGRLRFMDTSHRGGRPLFLVRGAV